ncbi:hypothetical protein JMJ77_0001775, partial [Colletotrichum scovillei]
ITHHHVHNQPSQAFGFDIGFPSLPPNHPKLSFAPRSRTWPYVPLSPSPLYNSFGRTYVYTPHQLLRSLIHRRPIFIVLRSQLPIGHEE